jgi:thiosulfate dehydrogenase [quinone] large subunit
MQTLTWRDQEAGALVLRLWLGITFTYAGIQKLSDPNFLHKGGSTYIGTQLTGFAKGSPIAPLLHLSSHFPVLTGAAVAFTELLIGIATLAGVAPTVAAGVGVLLSISLWLSASWHVHPYFLASDSIYAVAWLSYLLMLPSVRARVGWPAPVAVPAPAPKGKQAKSGQPQAASRKTASAVPAAGAPERRQILRGGAVVLGGLVVAGAAAKAAGAPTTPKRTPQAAPPSTPATSATAAPQAGGSVITTLPALQQQGAVGFNDPASGPAVVVSLGGDRVAAYSRVCTHAGCSVDYDPSSKLLICPCHGATYDPAAQAQVVSGPAPSPLAPINVVVDKASGQVRQA